MKYNLFLNYSISIQQLDKFKGWHMYFLQTSLCIDTGIMDSQIYQKIWGTASSPLQQISFQMDISSTR